MNEQIVPSDSPLRPGQSEVSFGEPILLMGKFSEQDWMDADRLLRGSKRRWVVTGELFGFPLLLCLVAMEFRRHSPEASRQILYVACVYPLLLGVPYFWQRMRFKRTIRRLGKSAHASHASLSDAGVHMRSEGWEFHAEWSAFKGYRASLSMCVLYYAQSPNQFLLFGRARFPDDETWEQFLGFVESRFAKA